MGWRKMNVEKKACRNKYDPLLSYVYFLDGIFLNTEIIKQGYGSAYTKYPFKYVEEIRRYEREARENKRGCGSKNCQEHAQHSEVYTGRENN